MKENHPMDSMTWKEKQKYNPQPRLTENSKSQVFVDKDGKAIGPANRKAKRRLWASSKKD